jgi:uncharacterized protein YjbJ (UPF0337 family)
VDFLSVKFEEQLFPGTIPEAAPFLCRGSERTTVRTMDKDRVKGMAEQAKGKIKEDAGKITGDEKLKAEGKMDQATGKIRNAAGGMKDAVKDAGKQADKHR